MSNGYHTTVLLESVLEYIITSTDGTYVDATIGGGGHAAGMLEHLSSKATFVGFDADADAIDYSKKRLIGHGDHLILIRENFSNMTSQLQQHNISKIDGVLLDLGVSSFQIDGPDKGFSFQRDEALDMRMDNRQMWDAITLINQTGAKDLERIFREYGEDRLARRIAEAVVRERAHTPIETTRALARLVQRVAGTKFAKKSQARIFQALRIAVNNELDRLQRALRDAMELLKIGGRIVVISYHSLEDRIVKDFFRSEAAAVVPSEHKLVPGRKRIPRLRVLTKKPIRPSVEEIRLNRRARSAKLRAAERV